MPKRPVRGRFASGLPRVAVLALVIAATNGQAQQVRGVVRDSATRQPVAEAAVLLLGARGASLARTSTGRDGAFVFATTVIGSEAAHVRVLKVGFKARDVSISELEQGGEINLARLLPTMDTVRAVANRRCRRDDSEARAVALWEDARTRLLASISNSPVGSDTILVVNVMDHDQHHIGDDHFYVPSMTPAAAWAVARTALERFLLGGDPRERDDVLLGDSFANAHCFRIERGGENERDTAVVFTPTAGQNAPVGVEGRLWIFGAHRGLRSLEFKYLRRSAPCGDGPFGSVLYEVAPEGEARIVDWSLACPSKRPCRSVTMAACPTLALNGIVFPEYPGKEADLAAQRTPDQWHVWGDSTRFIAMAPTLVGTVLKVAAGDPLPALRVALVNQCCQNSPPIVMSTTTDSLGRFSFTGLGKAAYTLQVADTSFARFRPRQFGLPPSVTFDRGSARQLRPRDGSSRDAISMQFSELPTPNDRPVVITVERPSVEQSFRDVCGRAGRGDVGIIVGRVIVPEDSTGAAGSMVTARWKVGPQEIARDVRADAQGFFQVCGVPKGFEVSLVAARRMIAASPVSVTTRRVGLTAIMLHLAREP